MKKTYYCNPAPDDWKYWRFSRTFTGIERHQTWWQKHQDSFVVAAAVVCAIVAMVVAA